MLAVRAWPKDRRCRVLVGILVAYLVVLAAVAFWPEHVDQGMGPFLTKLTELIPFLTYTVIEVAANVALFVPFGVLFALLLRHRAAVIPAGLLVSLLIEAGQSLMGGRRTPSWSDVVANTAGAALGIALVLLVMAWRDSRPR